MISKLLICPYFGELPPWMPHLLRNLDRLHDHGYEVLIDHDLRGFEHRVDECLDITCPPMYGHGKIWDFRPAFGVLYAPEIETFDWWGHIDFDVVLGRVEQFVTDEFLGAIDMHSNHDAYVNGCWSLYRNTVTMNTLFMEHPNWSGYLEDPRPNGWIEMAYSEMMMEVEREGRLRKRWTEWQVFKIEDLAHVYWDGDRLMLYGEEQMMAHFRRSKVYPPGCIQ